jgi:S1-C subfamily serine protease
MEISNKIDDLTVSHLERWRGRLRRLRTYARRALPFGSGVVAALLAVFLYSRLTPTPHQFTEREIRQLAAQVLASATAPPPFSERAYQIIQPSVVLIQSQAATNNGLAADSGLGSGVVVDDRGSILTSLHVVASMPRVQVVFADGTKTMAEIIATQPENDIAVLMPNQVPENLVPATLSGAARIGEEAFAVGNPFGLYGSMSAGVISGFNRTFQIPDTGQQLNGLIQFDAAVNPGNSGGPLVNRDGQVVGIVTAFLNPTKQNVFIGIGFAVPISTAGRAAGSPLD